MPLVLPPTSSALGEPATRPYFLWWTDLTVADFRHELQHSDAERRAYWLGALLREANTRDVWLFVTPADIRAAWPHIRRYLGRSRPMWAYLLGIDDDPVANTLSQPSFEPTSSPASSRALSRVTW